MLKRYHILLRRKKVKMLFQVIFPVKKNAQFEAMNIIVPVSIETK